MKHTYQVHGMKPGDPTDRIRQLLVGTEGVLDVEMEGNAPFVTITMHHHIPDDVLNERVAQAGDFMLRMQVGGYKHHGNGRSQEQVARNNGHQKHGHMDHHAGHHPAEHMKHHPATPQHEYAPHTEGKTHDGHPDHGGDGHHGHDHSGMIGEFRRRFWISLILTLPILVLTPMIQHWLGVDWRFPGDAYLLFALSTVVYFYAGWPFLKGLSDEIRSGNPGMMTLIGMAISVAYFYSVGTTFVLPGEGFYWELATLIAIMLLGHWIEMKSILGTSRALELLVSMLPSEAHRVDEAGVTDIRLQDILAGDVLLIKPGEKIPADGRIIEGESAVNESMLTGESTPVLKRKDNAVIGGSINGNGSLRIRVGHTGEESYLNKVITMVRDAQKSKSRMQNLADRAAKWLTYLALTAGFGTLAIWLALGKSFVFALERMVTVMVISCPHALGLAIPLVVAISTAVSARKGLLIRNRTAFEEARKITTIVFDKTGTLTTGKFGVTVYASLDNRYQKQEVLRYAAALEQYSEHPIATGIMDKATEEQLDLPEVSEFQAMAGKGVEATVEGKQVKVVSPGYLKAAGISIPDLTGEDASTIVYVLIDDALVGFMVLSDQIRPESKGAIETFRSHRIKVVMATGDNAGVAETVSRSLGLDSYYAEVLPDRKLEIVKDLQAKGEFVAMTGDGVNDAPALAQADVGIAVGSGTDIAAETADIILVNSNPQDIAHLILFGRATYRKMIQNLAWATGYNAFSIPLAAGILAPFGFVLSPALGAVLMSLSTVIVAVNAQLLKRQMR